MFYSHTFLARKSPLGTIWIAAHLEQRIKRTQIESIHIPSYAEKIMMPDVPIALRLSGHLLLGLVRIYSWKVNHLFSDCNRLVTDIRKAFAAVPVNLPLEADHAPFESVTLPETFDLDALELDELHHRTNEIDRHIKSYEQITLTDEVLIEGEQYVAVSVSEDNRMDLSPRSTNKLNPSPGKASLSPGSRQLQEDTLPPFEGGFESVFSPQPAAVADNVPSGQEEGYRLNLDGNSSPRGVPEIETMLKEPDFVGQCVDAPGNMHTGEQCSPADRPINSLSPIPEGTPVPEVDHSHSPHCAEQPVITSGRDLNFPNLEASSGQASPTLRPEPAPPTKPKKVKKRKRRQAIDRQIVLSNIQMKRQFGDTSDIVCKRRKLPSSDLDVWKFQRLHQKENIFYEPLLHGMSSGLIEVFGKTYPRSLANDAPLENAAPRDPVIEKEKGLAIAQIEATMIDAYSEIERGRDAENMEDLIPQFISANNSSFGSESHEGKHPEAEARPATGTPSPDVAIRLNLETSPFLLQDHLDDMEVPEAPGLQDSAGDLNFLDANIPPSPDNHGVFKVDNMSVRTRAVAKYFKDSSPVSQLDDSGHISLNRILVQKNRKQCSRMIFETLVLKSYGFINVEQEEAYGDILICPTPALFSTKF